MKIIFSTDDTMARHTAKITTHPDEKANWGSLERGLSESEWKLTVINPKNSRSLLIPQQSVIVIESMDRMCGITVATGERYQLNQRLKTAEQDLDPNQFAKINNHTIINLDFILEFSSADHARLQVILKDRSSHFVSRFYLKQFRGKLS